MEALYEIETCPVQTTIVVDRDPTSGRLVGYREVRLKPYILFIFMSYQQSKYCLILVENDPQKTLNLGTKYYVIFPKFDYTPVEIQILA